MATDTMEKFTGKFRHTDPQSDALSDFRNKGMADFKRQGIPAVKHEEWKYARVGGLFRDDLSYPFGLDAGLEMADIAAALIPGMEEGSTIVFVNGAYTPALSILRHGPEEMECHPLSEAAAGGEAAFISANLGHSAAYHPDGIHALNAAFAGAGLYLQVKKGRTLARPVHIHHFVDSRNGFTFAQPRILVRVEAGAQVRVSESYTTLGGNESFTNEVFELVAEQDAVVDYCKIQHEGHLANHVGTTHIRQTGRCQTNAVTVTLSGAMVRNNLNMVMEAEHGEAHMYGLSLLDGKTLADNHTIVDNVKPHCYSNELYKGIMDGESTGVFNGKIFVRQDAQKTNAYQSNKNILVGEKSAANTKPQLEIFADDVKCSHGCTVGRLDQEALFYLRARGLDERTAKSLLLHAFAVDILEKIRTEPLRHHVETLVSQRLGFND